ncbi:MAG: NnrS family protein [Polyangiaceae bacterium]|nr:NnrS family protein [Polyangiaceae bacterium]
MNERRTPAVDWRGEPFRLFFPLATVLGAMGVAHWMLYGTGVLPSYLASFHAVTQMQSFLLAFAAGFLLTAVPKRTRTEPAGGVFLGVLMLAIAGVSALELAGFSNAAQLVYALSIVLIAQFAVRRFVSRAAGRKPPASFVLVPMGLLSGLIGAVLRVLSAMEFVPSWLGALGRTLALEGVFTCLSLGIGGFFFGLALHGDPPPDIDKKPGETKKAAILAVAGLIVIASLVLQEKGWVREALLLRAAVCTSVLVSARGLKQPARPGVNRRTVWLAAWAIPLGLTLSAVFVNDRVAWMHVAYIGGFGLLAFAVAAHVTLGHGGDEAHRDGRPWQVIAFGALFTTAMVLRTLLGRLPDLYFGWMAATAGVWLLGAIVWAVFLVPRMWRAPVGEAAA